MTSNVMRKRRPLMTRHTLGAVLKYTFLTAMAIIVAFPYVWMILNSFKSGAEVFAKDSYLPKQWLWNNYPEAMAMAPFGRFFINSLITSLIVVCAQLVTCSLAAFSFAKLQFKSKGFFFTIFIMTMMIPGESTIVSNFLTISKLKLMNTYFALVATSLTSMFGIFLLRQFFKTIPDALVEAARIDGAGTMRVFFSVILPLAKSALATVVIFAFINNWNMYLWATIVTNRTEMRTVQTGLRYLVNPDLGNDWPKIMAASTVIILPVLTLFIFLQKYFIQGITKVGLK